MTDKGRAALNNGNEGEGQKERRGGTEHEYWKDRMTAHLSRRGYAVERERPLGGGKTVDVYAERNGKRIAVEIETGNSDAMANIRKDLDAGFDRVFSIALRTSLKERIEGELSLLPKGEREKVRIIGRRELQAALGRVGKAA